ncbi:WD40/YVTN/BNR-like repeat-containing protein [Paraflavitalea pollutisoli]|uniref:WD40/YVTN/BNR-like repeat-containing protein n=1 Tax=Paraflavitalea pollutisoli TaxID=3034143 RepID=UPI0023EDCCA6|nr:YCF48-related protein [Paraflavitalea sp. H1-2-19X]
MRYVVLMLLILSYCFAGCGKDDPIANPPVKEDTLTKGWSKLTGVPGSMEMFFVDNQSGFITGRPLHKTTDGGITWTALSLTVESPGIVNMYFTDATHGWMVGRSSQGQENLFRTTNGGASFTYITFANMYGLGDVQFLDRRRGFIVGRNDFHTSVDSGKTWTSVRGLFQGNALTLFFFDAMNGIVVSDRHIYRTSDGGSSFEMVQNLPAANIASTPFGIQFIDRNIGWVPCLNGVYKTTNGGQTWTFISVPGDGKDVHFFDQQEGYLLQTKAILKTTDGGNSFSKVLSTPNHTLYELQFNDKKHGWAVTAAGPLYRYLEQ